MYYLLSKAKAATLEKVVCHKIFGSGITSRRVVSSPLMAYLLQLFGVLAYKLSRSIYMRASHRWFVITTLQATKSKLKLGKVSQATRKAPL